MLPVPTVAELADWSGHDVTEFSGYARSALLQAALMLSINGELDVVDFNGFDPDDQLLVQQGMLAMGHYLYLRWDYQKIIASPMMNESIGSYNYAKAQQEVARNAAALEVNAERSGVPMYDLALQMLAKRTRAGGVFSGGITVFEEGSAVDQAELLIRNSDGRMVIVGPAERDRFPVPFVISGEVFPHDPGGSL